MIFCKPPTGVKVLSALDCVTLAADKPWLFLLTICQFLRDCYCDYRSAAASKKCQ